jgi:hypothetical protein
LVVAAQVRIHLVKIMAPAQTEVTLSLGRLPLRVAGVVVVATRVPEGKTAVPAAVAVIMVFQQDLELPGKVITAAQTVVAAVVVAQARRVAATTVVMAFLRRLLVLL